MTPVAHFEWRMPSRALGWVEAWDSKTATYNDDYISPQKWMVILDASQSDDGGSEISLYRWEIQGFGGITFSLDQEHSVDARDLEHWNAFDRDYILRPLLPSFGRYRVTLTVTNRQGEKSDPVSEIINVQDLLIVSIGDSMASGEGNPEWADQRCHRSPRSGHALTAVEMEGPHRSVTFLSFACSGANAVGGGIVGTYDGMDPPDGKHQPLVSQLDAVTTALGTNNRIIDILLVTAGINDVGFTDLLNTFAYPHPVDWDAAHEARLKLIEKLDKMPNVYTKLAWALSKSFHGKVKQVYITEYPCHIFQPHPVYYNNGLVLLPNGEPLLAHDGCGPLQLISESESDFIFERGLELNQHIQVAAESNGWQYVSGIVKAFEGHGYCENEDTRWYVHYFGSKKKQGNKEGTIHPGPAGQRAIRDQIIAAIQAPKKETVQRSKQVTVIFQKFKVNAPVDGFYDNQDPILLSVNGQTGQHAPVRLNHEVLLPEKDFTFTFFVNDGLAGSSIELSASTVVGPMDPEQPQVDPTPGSQPHSHPMPRRQHVGFVQEIKLGTNFGVGSHISGTTGPQVPGLEVHYHISVIDELIAAENWLEPVLNMMMN